MKYLIYTFRTFPYLDKLQKISPNIFVLGKLKEDLDKLLNVIVKEKPNIIIGIAKSISGKSYIEQTTINKFNDGKVIKDGPLKYSLFIPDVNELEFEISKTPSRSFCNYSMYKIKHFLEENKLNIPFIFIHIKEDKVEEIGSILTQLQTLRKV